MLDILLKDFCLEAKTRLPALELLRLLGAPESFAALCRKLWPPLG